jgi:hypothetical protein
MKVFVIAVFVALAMATTGQVVAEGKQTPAAPVAVAAEANCSVTMSMEQFENGKTVHKLTSEYKNSVTPETAQGIVTRGQQVLNATTNGQNKPGAANSFKFNGSTDCPGVTILDLAEIKGLTDDGAANVWNTALDSGKGTVKASQKHKGKGHKSALGKE